jgi:hypothetical protein
VDDLPSRRASVRGVDFDGNEVTLSWAISKQLYRCPGCREYIDVGREHVVVRVAPPSGGSYHPHRPRGCTATIKRELRSARSLPSR